MKEKIVKFGKLLYEKDLTYGTSGNMSIRLGNKIYITGTGTALGFLNEKGVVEIDLDGNEFNSYERASSEKYLHTQIYKMRPDIKAIIHCHAPYTTAFASCKQELSAPIMSETILYFGKIPVADYAMPSSQELVNNTAKFFDTYDTVLMANHGIIAGAENIENAFCKIETAENYAKTYIYSKLIGSPVLLQGKDIEDLEQLRKKIHGK